jgi:hypothetical protein
MRHRGRKYIIGAASAAGVLAFAIAPAAGAATSTTPTLSPNLAKCKGTLVVQLTTADMGIPPANGVQKGTVRCKKGLGKGREVVTYRTNLTTGNLTGTFSITFKKKIHVAGSKKKKKVGKATGKILLIPQEGTLGGTGGLYSAFGAVGYAGTLKFKGVGTGIFNGVKGIGSLVESSQDGMTFKVVEKVIH